MLLSSLDAMGYWGGNRFRPLLIFFGQHTLLIAAWTPHDDTSRAVDRQRHPIQNLVVSYTFKRHSNGLVRPYSIVTARTFAQELTDATISNTFPRQFDQHRAGFVYPLDEFFQVYGSIPVASGGARYLLQHLIDIARDGAQVGAIGQSKLLGILSTIFPSI